MGLQHRVTAAGVGWLSLLWVFSVELLQYVFARHSVGLRVRFVKPDILWFRMLEPNAYQTQILTRIASSTMEAATHAHSAQPDTFWLCSIIYLTASLIQLIGFGTVMPILHWLEEDINALNVVQYQMLRFISSPLMGFWQNDA